MLELKNITLKELYSLNNSEVENYNFAMEYSKPFLLAVDHFEIGDVLDWEFGTVKEIQSQLETGETDFTDWLRWLSKLSGKESFKNEKILQVCQAIAFLKKSIEQVITLETENLGHTPDADEEEADLSDLSKMGVFLQFDSLAGGDITKHDAIKKLPYSDCFAKMLKDKYSAEYTKRLQKIKSRKP